MIVRCLSEIIWNNGHGQRSAIIIMKITCVQYNHHHYHDHHQLCTTMMVIMIMNIMSVFDAITVMMMIIIIKKFEEKYTLGNTALENTLTKAHFLISQCPVSSSHNLAKQTPTTASLKGRPAPPYSGRSSSSSQCPLASLSLSPLAPFQSYLIVYDKSCQ